TYFARLCLVQVACAQRIAVIDILALDGPVVLAAALATPARVKLLHAARQDLEVLHFAGLGLAAPLVDTQVAAALAGFDEQIGYAELVRELLGITLDKSQTRTDWRQRPLSARQLQYAADDVRHLDALGAALRERLEALGRTPWLDEECAGLADPAVYDPPLRDAWQRVKGLAGAPPAAFAAGVLLARWREERARERDLPRGWVLKDAELLALAHAAPRNLAELAALLTDNPAFVRRHGDAVLAVLGGGLAADDDAVQAVSAGPPSPAQRQRAKDCAARVRACAESLGISPAVLLTRREIERLVAGQAPARAVRGWRAAPLAAIVAEFGTP
ncbi:MAG: HRDC domain-containing protein, partial [Gammaproteobacteria bacterium]